MLKFAFGSIYLLLFTSLSWGQSSLLGSVIDQNQNTIPGAVLHLDKTQYYQVSDHKGQFSFLNLKDGNYKINCHSLGYRDTSIEIFLSSKAQVKLILQSKLYFAEEVVVRATRSSEHLGLSSQVLEKKEIDQLNTGQDLPYLLQFLPSAVVTSDAGNGIGYTGIRIRGSDATRVNVTINGIPLNDAESQGVYWVNLPDMASSTQNIEVTRGAGSSTNGSGAFGGTINILSQQLNDSAFFSSSNAFGSFNTLKNNISFGTGLLNNHFSFEGRLSKMTSDGYVDRAKSDLKSFYFSTAYRDQKNLVRLNIFSGKEITYQSWNGIPESRWKGNVDEMMAYIDRNGLSDEEAKNLLSSGHTYNYYTYKNQNDNYQQDHYQLLTSRSLSKSWIANIALHATKGKGFYEEYKYDQELENYGMSTAGSPDSLITTTDLVRRRWLDNWFYGVTWSLLGNVNEKVHLTLGGAANRYDGIHFGEVIWARNAGNSELTKPYYENDARKDDINSYVKADFSLSSKINFFVDVQYRRVNYSFLGPNEFSIFLQQEVSHNFLNPKVGLSYMCNSNLSFYSSAAVAQKEPNRSDYIESSANSRPKAEKMIDYEVGTQWTSRTLRAGLNFYYMNYTDQLILTGKVNDVGSYTRSNISKSYRTGIEFETAIQLAKKITLQGNITFSENKIPTYTEFIDAYDATFTNLGQEKLNIKTLPSPFHLRWSQVVRYISIPSKKVKLVLSPNMFRNSI
ncbi:MAG: TonB-dependent receptor [Bacteroidetes bacterium]|nr:TonB-dependent receptor [Bacteroidota bacterium]